jgi:type II secretion system protein G
MSTQSPGRKGARHGFTLIELLIVVAIIAILAAIAVPNFLEAQTRSKVSRAQADMRTLATALEAYHVDVKHYPFALRGNAWFGELRRIAPLTTPIAYITSIPLDPFQISAAGATRTSYWDYSDREAVGIAFGYATWDVAWGNKPNSMWRLASNGPDQLPNFMGLGNSNPSFSPSFEYDATNGTISPGDIVRWGP